ncbi:MAG: ROK family protein [candidate division Zixibacteria bacterium]|nr:ROK family protein [candidate division Zixibacteria bacterium]
MSNNQVYAGIDIGATNIKFGLVSHDGKIIYREQRPTLVEKGPEPLMHLVTNISESLLYYAAEEDYNVRWLGVGTPGAVDNREGKVIGCSPNIRGWEGMEIGRILRERLNLPVLVDNDVNVMALAEARFGAAVGYKSVVCVTVGTGIGGGIILDGRLWRGANYTAGELGHITIDMHGPPCRCGNRGCIEAFCSSQAIISRANNKLKNNLTPIFEEILEGDLNNLNIKKLFAAVKKNDEIALDLINETAMYLGIGLAGVVNLFNPEIVVIGGGVADGGTEFVDRVASQIKAQAFKPATEKLRVARATLGNDAGFIGAGILGEMIV